MSSKTKTPGMLAPTPGQTVGPFFAFGMVWDGGPELVPPASPGAIALTGRVLDGNGDPVPDAIVEIWQADADGAIPTAQGTRHRDGFTFSGFGRSATDADGVYRFWTVEPGSVGGTAPFFSVVVFARGLLDKLHTRIYLPGDEAALAADPLLASLGSEERADLIAERIAHGQLRRDIRLQGERETVFLAFE